jgi:hypothetical protein
MAYGQIDPARLEGEALRRWYLRSPAEIEDEQRSAAAESYDQFFSPRAPVAKGSQRERLTLEPTSDFSGTRWRGGFAGLEPWSKAVSWSDQAAAQHPLANRSASGASSHETPESCATCHGRVPPPRLPPLPLPPPFGPFPWPIGPFPSFRDIPVARPERPDRDRKQCEMQYQNDGRICAGQPKPQDVAICRASASKRLAHCNANDGEVGTPALDTAKRLRGR